MFVNILFFIGIENKNQYLTMKKNDKKNKIYTKLINLL